MKEGKEISPVDLTLLKILRRGLQLALLAGRGLLFQVLQGEMGTNQNHPYLGPLEGVQRTRVCT